MDIKITSLGTRELWEQFQKNPTEIYSSVANRMKDAGIDEAPTLTRALEEINPSEPNDKLDAYERLMQEAGIRTKSNPEAGVWASNAGKFLHNPGTRALLTEFFARNWRKVSVGGQRATFLSNDGVAGSWERPYADAMTPRLTQQLAPAIPLAELVAMTTPITGADYRSYYLTVNAAQLRAYRVGESAEIPITKIVGSDRSIRLKKYGRALQASYEDLRRMRVDKLAYFIQLMAVQSEVDKVVAVIDTLVNGDGNSGAPGNHNLTTLDTAATAGTLTLKGWLSFKMQFPEPYMVNTALMQEAVALQLALLNTGSANVPLAGTNLAGLGTGAAPINMFADLVRYGWNSNAPSLKIVGFDNRMAVERVTEIGSEISEMDRFITSQTQVLTMSEYEGYAILDINSIKTLNVNA